MWNFYVYTLNALRQHRNMARIIQSYSQKHINKKGASDDFSTNCEIPSMLEASVLKETEAHGGNGFAASTVQGLGIQPAVGATS